MRRFGCIMICLVTACNENEVTSASATPDRQFVFENLQIQERKDGKVVWQGTARRADGDLSDANVQDVTLRCTSQEGEGRAFDVIAPRAHLWLDQEKARFEEVRIIDAQGMTLDAGAADYDGAGRRISATGPLLLTASGLSARATQATVMLDTGQVDIVGPVEGRFQKPTASPPRP